MKTKITPKPITLDRLHLLQYRRENINHKKDTREFFMRKNHNVAFAASLVLIFCSIFWVVFDLFAERQLVLNKPISIIGDSLLFTAGILMLVNVLFIKNQNSIWAILIYYVYFLLVYAGVGLLNIGHSMGIAAYYNDGVISSTNGIGFLASEFGPFLASLCICVLVLTPIPEKFACLYVAALSILECILPGLSFMPGHEVYPLVQTIVLTVSFFAVYVYMFILTSKGCDSERELETITYTDELTKALNRTALTSYLETVGKTEEGKNVGAIMFDIDDFKKYNDKYSHPEGDKILKEVIFLAYSCINKNKDLLFRYGGEEFIVLIPNATIDDVIFIAASIRSAVINANIQRDDGGAYPYLTLTLGCAVVNLETDDYVSVIDEQLYKGKRSTKNCVVCNNEVVIK